MLKLFCALILTLLSYFLSGQGFENKIDSLILTEFNEANVPGGVFLVAKKGKVIYRKAFGRSNLELGTDMATQSIFQIGSMTKQFTAVAILMLEQQGKLNVNDPVSKYIADFPNGNNITLHHLLNHTSGIKDFTKMKSISDIAQKQMSPMEMVGFFKDEPVDFQPGEKFEYNNSGYVLLGYIIEAVSGKTYEEFIKEHIFDKAGMQNSFYATDRKIIKNRAYGYHQKADGYVNKTIINFSVPYASGSLMSTVDDMFKWQVALKGNLLLNEKQTKKAFSKSRLSNGEMIEYGYGWHLKEINGMESREHGGSIFGFKSMGVYIAEKDIYVIGLSNCDCNSPTQIVRDIAGLF
ncbi:serine hydrolase domain-containing protein [Moheibacter sediminis]|uniref:CubicO group peptidase, beta-lactamase class C family n=1 Tax=Moheibacter sediminis TaxID=1434700 RepID=A0A1W2D1F6_9FLAO|nr:serine hydrolase domain-containing protein [Moheibacter sediminis]SMC90854.1 CubicO group peptidase, beta-lactamase class C family [Moheibacter sediminis]